MSSSFSDNDRPLVSVVVVNFEGLRRGRLINCLESLFKTEYPHLQIIVVDNASSDGSAGFIKKNYPSVRLIENKVNLGYSAGSNEGIRQSTGEYLVLLNNDTRVAPGWLDHIVSTLQEDEKVGVAGCKILCYDDPKRIDSAGCYIDVAGWPLERGRYFGKSINDAGQYDDVTKVFYVLGAAIALRKRVLNQIGNLDPKFFMYFEEVDLCWRAILRGYKVIYVPDTVIYHKRAPNLPSSILTPEILYHMHKNHLATLLKNYSFHGLLRALPWIIFDEILAIIGCICGNDVEGFAAVLDGIFWNLKELKYLLKKRRVVQREVRRVSDKEVLKLMIERNLVLDRLRSVINEKTVS